jgi:undecaprenyl-diphosphatase
VNRIELDVLDVIARYARNSVLDVLFPGITMLGDSDWIWIVIAILLLCFCAYRKAGITLATALLLEWGIVNLTLKPLFDRMRPFMLNPAVNLLITKPTDGSFPSGHTAAAFASAFVIYHFNKRWGVAAYTLAILIALSRLYLYVHFPTDVLGGMIIGTLVGLLAVLVVGKVDRMRQPKAVADQESDL